MTDEKLPSDSPADPSPLPAQRLRRRAEDIARWRAAATTVIPDSLPPEAARQLMHELQVHQIELEMQNEELRRTQAELEASRARYFDLYDLAPVGYFTLNEKGIILEANLTAADLLGMTRSALINQPISRFILPADQDLYYRHRKQLLATGTLQVVDLRLVKPGAEPFWARLEANRAWETEEALVFRVVVSDIAEHKSKEERLRQAAVMFEGSREGVMVTDASERILIVNRAFCEITGYSAEEVLGQTPRVLNSGHQDAAFFEAMWARIEATGHWQGEISNRRKNGEVYPQMLSISSVQDESGQVTQYVGVFSDVSQLKNAASRLDFLAHHDPLTGLPNRLLLYARLEHSLDVARRERKSLALLMLDLDRFKDVNDSYGHLAGDELLQKVAQRLTSRLRGIDTVTRLGGDEFSVLLDDLSHPQDAALVATEIIESLGEPWRLSNCAEVRIGASVGISLFPEHGKTSEELLKNADAALYRAKSEGRGNFKYFSDDLTYAARRRLKLESLLRRAIDRNELLIHYQAQIEIESGRIVGAEALIRWRHATEGWIPPSQFIPVAEETGLIASIGGWALGEVCRQGVSWIEAGLPPLKLAVNLSPHQFRHGDISGTIAGILSETGFPPERLELELTESALMEREDEVVAILRQLRDLGVRLAIDDFGTGYSSLAFLKRFPLDVLKIDKSFIEEIPQKPDDQEIAAAIVAMGHILRLKVLAEGVETVEQLDFLKTQGCDYYQGHYHSPAVPAEKFVTLVQEDGRGTADSSIREVKSEEAKGC
ncbi:bifunctional diguanylate cyclase/phosphodiesterase [Methylococcus sp. EFPC2]|uniref:putative bifunctional diguanylate cyclase/phosphodiesterase n=1 Tax=Methylococcus sp. EFPC2 TaxID=2812648 RepID=UPI001967A02F|nr:EAL domain-containing protein [Methylococcus sp. EFPC2]QSA98495.1 EAL domain-containing protein [Methylococcus sp. EFPC2]